LAGSGVEWLELVGTDIFFILPTDGKSVKKNNCRINSGRGWLKNFAGSTLRYVQQPSDPVRRRRRRIRSFADRELCPQSFPKRPFRCNPTVFGFEFNDYKSCLRFLIVLDNQKIINLPLESTV